MKSDYYLLTFNEDWADEHDVPALACMTTSEYKEWLETPSGDIDSEYDKKLADFREKCDKWNIYQEAASKAARDKTLESRKAADELICPYVNSYHDEPSRINSHLYASLGNNGEGFGESYQHLYLMKEFVEEKYVKITKVNEEFYRTFHKANLASLSLCNIFTIKEN